MSTTTLGLTPGAAGIQQYSGTPVVAAPTTSSPVGTTPDNSTASNGTVYASAPVSGSQAAQYGGPLVEPEVTSAQQVQTQTQADDIAQATVQSRLLAVQTAASLQQEIDGTAHTISQEALSDAAEHMSDEIQQAKKIVDAANKAV